MIMVLIASIQCLAQIALTYLNWVFDIPARYERYPAPGPWTTLSLHRSTRYQYDGFTTVLSRQQATRCKD